MSYILRFIACCLSSTNKLLPALIMALFYYSALCQNNSNIYLSDLKRGQMAPLKLVKEALKKHDLIVFDDGIHSAKEPFDFYCELIKDSSIASKLDYIFVEVLNTNSQVYIDSFLLANTIDSLLLSKVFQDDYSGYGWKYRTYLDLLTCIWEVNHVAHKNIKVIAVSPPVYWSAFKNRSDYEIFQNSLSARDYFMYQSIKSGMANFKKGKKGVFLTNTRHAYKQIKDSTGAFYWNTNTFFTQWDAGKSYSIRIHNASISITRKKVEVKKITTEGLNEYDYKWVLPKEGLWDSAFIKNGKFPIALPLANNSFGRSEYIGNLMTNVKKGATQYDAYDALIVLRPYYDWHFTATLGYFYTSEFKKELARRINIMEEGAVENLLRENEVTTLEEFIDKFSLPIDVTKNSLVK